jgi:hypothetical protein
MAPQASQQNGSGYSSALMQSAAYCFSVVQNLKSREIESEEPSFDPEAPLHILAYSLLGTQRNQLHQLTKQSTRPLREAPVSAARQRNRLERHWSALC